MSYRDYEPVDLVRADFKIHQLESLEKDNLENAFAGYISEVLGRINDGKEATVYLCRGTGESAPYLAAKVFKARHFRHFDTDRNYRNLGKMKDKRMAKAMRKRSKVGDVAFHRSWVKSEFAMLSRLRDLGVTVPEPIAEFADGILMEYIGTKDGPAPRMVTASLTQTEAASIVEQLATEIRLMLDDDIVHGDFSAYNILIRNGKAVIIDVPQAMDLRTTPEAYSAMQRDLTHLDEFFSKKGVNSALAEILWRYQ